MAGNANSIGLIEKYASDAWDTVYKAESMSSMLDTPSTLLRFTGAKTVKIAKFTSGGLNDYYRANERVSIEDSVAKYGENGPTGYNEYAEGEALDFDTYVDGSDKGYGYQKSNLGLKWEEFTLNVDRAAKFVVEKFDDEESGGQLVGNAITEISRTSIIPEVDAYCFAKIASYASEALGNRVHGEFAKDANGNYKPFAALNDAFLYLDDHEIPAENQIIFTSNKFVNALRSTPELVRHLTQAEYSSDVKFRVMEYEGRKLVPVPPQRFNTGIVLYNGGYRLTGQPIDFMLVAKDAVIHVVKYNKQKILQGDMALATANVDGFVIFSRIYHDVFVPDNKRLAIYVHTGGFTTYTDVQSGKNAIALEVTASGKIKDLDIYPQNLFVKFYKTTAAPTLGNIVTTGLTAVKINDVLAENDYVVAIDSRNRVVAFTQYIKATE